MKQAKKGDVDDDEFARRENRQKKTMIVEPKKKQLTISWLDTKAIEEVKARTLSAEKKKRKERN